MKDYQQKKMNSYVLPQPVYRQALWAVKDMARLLSKLEEMKQNAYTVGERDYLFPCISKDEGRVCDVTAIKAVDIAFLSQRIEAIEKAFEFIPPKYRDGIRQKLMYDIPYSDSFHHNTWKKWQQVYIYNVAVNLHIL